MELEPLSTPVRGRNYCIAVGFLMAWTDSQIGPSREDEPYYQYFSDAVAPAGSQDVIHGWNDHHPFGCVEIRKSPLMA